MTTLEAHGGVEAIFQRLDAVRSRRWILRLAAGCLAAGTFIIGVVIVAAALAGYWADLCAIFGGQRPDQPPTALRWCLLVGMAAIAAGALAWFIGRTLLWRQNPAQVARFIEQNLPELRNDLINSVLLAADRQQISPELVEMAIREAKARADRVDLNRSISMRSMRRWGIAAGVAAVCLAAFVALQPQAFTSGLMAVLRPNDFVRVPNRIELLKYSPEDGATIFAGDAVTITAGIRNDAATPYEAKVIIDGQAPQPMFASDACSTFSFPIAKVDQSFRYAIRIGSSRWPADKPFFSVNVIKRVEVKGIDLTYECPQYTGLKVETKENTDGHIEAPTGTKAMVTLRLATGLPAVTIDIQGVSAQPMTAALGGTRFTAVVPVNADGAYRMLLLDPNGKVLQQLPDTSNDPAGIDVGQKSAKGYYTIRAIPDDPPKVAVVVPGRDVAAAPGGKLPMKVRAFDRYGLTEVKLYAGLADQEAKPVAGFPPGKITRNDMEFNFPFDLSAYKKGDVVVYYATATDNRNLPGVGGPQTSVSDKFKITVQDPAEVAAEKAKRYEELRRRLAALLKIEEEQYVNCNIAVQKHDDYRLAKDPKPDVSKLLAALADDMLAAQRSIRTELIDIVEKFPFDEDTGKLQGEIATLANNEASVAIEQAKALAAMSVKDQMGRQAAALSDTQFKIIDALRTLLAIMPSLANKTSPLDKATSRPTELTPEARDKLTALKNDLEKFMDEQKKLIAAAERLSKKPVDDFNEEDQKLLNDLKTAQDKWEKFLNEAFNDFSKMAQQDFSNPVLMKELISVKSDITMAKDALNKKATEIATALEDNGIENAKTLTANIEKWLPDKPDREKWSMEDPGNGQTSTEQPELPKELEDLVGDLLEQEEDLFQQMEDQTSKYNMSGDKGIGWDATDGPISNMNAQGVTGNQLPNNDELSGRSGQGRSGKSTGEFVEDKATDKGGRRTPTRLTPEPFSKGEVKDDGKESAGGSTGGGKLSGGGGEGLEGPVPAGLQKEMKRLAGKQATLMNKAERVAGKFGAADPSGIKLLESITLMSGVRKDLENFRYKNVLRARKDVINTLTQSKLLLTGGIDVTSDTSVNMPKYIMDDISDAMKGKLPEEFREALKQYYTRLSEQPNGK
ncbi:MAG: hypothetical protein ACE15C_00045 [Phycisphaerae bacterium]